MNGSSEDKSTALQVDGACEDLSFTHLMEAHAKQLTALQTLLCATHFREVHKLEVHIQGLQKENKELRSQAAQSEIHIDDSLFLGEVLGVEGFAPSPPETSLPTQLPNAWASETPSDQNNGNGSTSDKAWPSPPGPAEEAVSLLPSGFQSDQALPLNGKSNLSDSVSQCKDMDCNASSRQSSKGSAERKAASKGSPLLPDSESPPKEMYCNSSERPSSTGANENEVSLVPSPLPLPSAIQDENHTKQRGSVTFSAVAPTTVEFCRQDSEEDPAASSCNSADYSSKASDDDDSDDDDSDKDDANKFQLQLPKIQVHGHRCSTLNSHQESLLEVAQIWMNTRQRFLSRSVTSSAIGEKETSQPIQHFSQRSSVHSTGTTSSSIFAPLVWYLLHPGSKAAYIWEVLGLLLLVYDLVVVPFDFLDAGETQFTIVLCWTISIYWTLTIGVACFKGYIDEDGSPVFDHLSIIKRYARTWMLPDLVALSFSWADLLVNDRTSGRVSLLVSEMRLVRLLRLTQAPAILGLTFEHVRSDRGVLVIGILQIVMLIITWAHFIACFWYGVGRLDTSDGQGWVEREGLQDDPLPNRYIRSFSWALTAFVGDASIGHNVVEQGYTASVILLSFLISTSFISSLTTSMTQLQIVSSQHSRNMSQLRHYLTDNVVSRDLAVKLMRNATHALNEKSRRVQESSIELLNAISEPLLAELHFELRGRHLSSHPLFRDYSYVNASGLRKVCHIACQFYTFAMGDTVFHEFEVPASPRMLFLIEGGLVYKFNKDTETINMQPGHWASEAAIWLATWTYMGTMTAHCEAQVMALDAQRFQRSVHTFPSAHLKVYARYFSDHAKRLFEDRLLTDLCADEMELETVVDDAFRVAEDDGLLTQFNEERTSMRGSGHSGAGRRGSHMSSDRNSRSSDKRGSIGSVASQRSFSGAVRTSLRTSVNSLRSTNKRGSRTRKSLQISNRRPSMMVAVKQWL